MRRIRSAVTVGLAVAVTLTACTDLPPGVTSTTATTVPATPTSTVPPVVECPGAGEFGEGGGIADIAGDGSDASWLGRISWEASDPCETFVFEFETSEGAPATTVPNIGISHLESFQIIRIRLDIDGTVLTDQLVETDLVDRVFAVQGLDGGMFVDLHLAAPAGARARVDASPARLIVDLRPGFVTFEGQAAISDSVVVVSPTQAGAVDATTQFMGYARTFESNVRVIVTQGDTVATETNTTSADSVATWGEFREELGLPPGEISVFFGEADPENGGLDGITLDLTVS